MATKASLPSRLHHTAYVSRDLEATRKFYEDVIGLPLLATWCEKDMLFGAERTYCHLFFGLADGGALAFFQFADPADQEQFGPEDAVLSVPSHRLERRQADAGWHREAVEGCRLRGAAVVRARTWLLPLGVRHRSERHDRASSRTIIRTSRTSTRSRSAARTASSSAGWPAITPRTTRSVDADQHRPHPHHARRQPAALAGGHRRIVRARAQHDQRCRGGRQGHRRRRGSRGEETGGGRRRRGQRRRDEQDQLRHVHRGSIHGFRRRHAARSGAGPGRVSATARKAREARLDREIPPPEVRGRDPQQDLRAAAGRPAAILDAVSRRAARSTLFSTRLRRA